jgi:hypothetical protein
VSGLDLQFCMYPIELMSWNVTGGLLKKRHNMGD